MTRFLRCTQMGLTLTAAALLVSQPAWTGEINVHVPNPEIRVPTPHLRAPDGHGWTRDAHHKGRASTGQAKGNGSQGSGSTTTLRGNFTGGDTAKGSDQKRIGGPIGASEGGANCPAGANCGSSAGPSPAGPPVVAPVGQSEAGPPPGLYNPDCHGAADCGIVTMPATPVLPVTSAPTPELAGQSCSPPAPGAVTTITSQTVLSPGNFAVTLTIGYAGSNPNNIIVNGIISENNITGTYTLTYTAPSTAANAAPGATVTITDTLTWTPGPNGGSWTLTFEGLPDGQRCTFT